MNLIPFLTWCPKHPAAVLKCCSHLVYLQSRGVYVQMFFSILDWANQTWRMIWSLLCNCTIHHQILERWKYCKAGRTHSRQPWVQDMSASSLNLTTGFFKTALLHFMSEAPWDSRCWYHLVFLAVCGINFWVPILLCKRCFSPYYCSNFLYYTAT